MIIKTSDMLININVNFQ